MNEVARDFWQRALDAFRVAQTIICLSPDSAASRAYYAAFYAVSAHFALAGRTFRKHSAVEAAVHRDLVKAGHWPAELGQGYTRLLNVRSIGDYGGSQHVSEKEAREVVGIAATILKTVSDASSGILPPPFDADDQGK